MGGEGFDFDCDILIINLYSIPHIRIIFVTVRYQNDAIMVNFTLHAFSLRYFNLTDLNVVIVVYLSISE